MNTLLIEQFNLLVKQVEAEYLNAQVENDVKEISMHKYRLLNVKKVLNTLRKLDFDVVDADDLNGIPGIGPGTLRRIKEILDTGRLSELKSKYDKKKQATIEGIQELEKIIGVGTSIAKKLVTKYGIKSVADLKKAIKDGKYDANDKLKLGLKYYGIVEGNIPRKEVSTIEKYLTKEIKKIDPLLEIIICGSYRRGKKTSGDIDVLMYHPQLKTSKYINDPEKYGFQSYLEILIDTLYDKGFILDHITDKNYKKKYMGFCQYKTNPVRRIDIRFIPYNSLATAMLYFTGPYELNIEMRKRAEKRKMFLNEYGLYKVGENENDPQQQLKVTSEADVFEYLGMDYLTPAEREEYSSGRLRKTKN